MKKWATILLLGISFIFISPETSWGQTKDSPFLANVGPEENAKSFPSETTVSDNHIPGDKERQQDDSTRQTMWNIARQAQKEYQGNLTQSIGITIAIVGFSNAMILLAIGYYIIKRNKQYMHVARDARETYAQAKEKLTALTQASNQAENTHDQLQQSFSQIRHWETKTRDKLHTMYAMHTQLAKEVLKKIETSEINNRSMISDSTAIMAQLIDESERQKNDIEQKIKMAILTLETRTNEAIKAFTKSTNPLPEPQEGQSEKQLAKPGILSAFITETEKSGDILEKKRAIQGPLKKIMKLREKAKHEELLKKYDRAADYYEEIVHLNPDDYNAFYCWGNVLAKGGAGKGRQDVLEKLLDACTKYHKAITVKPDYYEALNNWGIVLKNRARLVNEIEADALFEEAYEKFSRSLEINSDNHEAWDNWGNTLMAQATKKCDLEMEKLLEMACRKYEKTLALKPEKARALHNWGIGLFRLANHKNGDARRELLGQAEEKWLTAEAICKGISTTNLASLNAMQSVEGECEKWLEIGQQAGAIEIQKDTMSQHEFATEQEKQWFKDIMWN